MSERCHQCKERPSKGGIGMLRLCYRCVAGMTGESIRMVRSRRVDIRIMNGREFLGLTEWVPDFIAARYKPKDR